MTQQVGALRYVCIEMIAKKYLSRSVMTEIEKEVVYGLFAGIKVIMKDQTAIPFVIIYTPDKKYKALNILTHTVISMESYEGLTRTYLYCRSTDEDQKEVFDVITSFASDLMSDHRMRRDNVFVNIDSYSDLPDGFVNFGKTVKKTTTTATFSGASRTTTHQTNNTNYWNTNRTPTIMFWKRSSEKPQKTLLNKMKELVNQITDGTYEQPEIKKIDVPTVAVNTPDNFSRNYLDDYS